MNKLALSVDTRNRGMPVAQASSYINYYSDADLVGEKIPEGARFMEVTVLGPAPAWVKFGLSDTVEVDAPSTDITDGSCPIVVTGALLFEIPPRFGYFAMECPEEVVISFWS